MKNIILFAIAMACMANAYTQEKIFSIGYGKTFVTNDSSTVTLTFDLNRVPGQSERAGGYFFVNELFDTTSRWRYYVKPMMDVNLGTGTASSPNNISVGLPGGIAYDFKETGLGIFTWYLEGSPELIADKTMKNNLYYFSLGTYIKYELSGPKALVNVLTGVFNANGVRHQPEVKGDGSDSYGRITVPLYFKLVALNASNERTNRLGVKKGRKYRKLHWTNTLKFSHVYADNATINTKTDYTFFNSRLDFYITPTLAFNVTYFNGNEEPVFKRNNAISFGLSLAR